MRARTPCKSGSSNDLQLEIWRHYRNVVAEPAIPKPAIVDERVPIWAEAAGGAPVLHPDPLISALCSLNPDPYSICLHQSCDEQIFVLAGDIVGVAEDAQPDKHRDNGKREEDGDG